MFRWLSRARRGPALPPQPPAAKDWIVGDVAKCIAGHSNGQWINKRGEILPGPRYGQLSKVLEVIADDTVYLRFAAWPSSAFAAGNFKKLRTCSADFGEQIRRCTPVSGRNPELVR